MPVSARGVYRALCSLLLFAPPSPSQIHSQHYLALVVQNLKPGAVGEVGAVVVGEHELHLLLVLLRVQRRRRRQGVRSRMVRPRRQRRRRLLGDSDSHGA
jgi:hypothetical protein